MIWRVNELLKEVEYLNNESWMCEVKYLKEIYEHLSSLNSNMQGRKENTFTSTEKLAVTRKIAFCRIKIKLAICVC